jgi:hypothetical protein
LSTRSCHASPPRADACTQNPAVHFMKQFFYMDTGCRAHWFQLLNTVEGCFPLGKHRTWFFFFLLIKQKTSQLDMY